MGKGDKKSKRGKIILGSYGIKRPRKKPDKPVIKLAKVTKEKAIKEVKPVKEVKEVKPVEEVKEVKPVKEVKLQSENEGLNYAYTKRFASGSFNRC